MIAAYSVGSSSNVDCYGYCHGHCYNDDRCFF